MARLRLLTFNIAHARGLSLHQGLRVPAQFRHQLLKIARLIVRVEADIVALQEIDENSRWSGSFDHLQFLRDHTGLPHSIHGVNNRLAGSYHLNYGNGILSRWPFVHSENVPFGQKRIGGKGFLFVEINHPQGRLPLLDLHLDHRSRPHRLRQAQRLMRFLDEVRGRRAAHWRMPPILCGDLNNPAHWPDATAVLLGYLEERHDYMLLPKSGHGSRTFPSPWPQRSLDFVFLPATGGAVHTEVVRSMLSDHRPVLVEFNLA
ncbi:MAG: endonuclease/exonuclease/phosphatase family protein [Opitutaceae bacterium]|nr:endonuclease/exonuclease/phosphatase family protein [Opitutaceae bacterium]